MEQTAHSPEVYDFRQYDRIWQRVAPTLEPYPTSQQNVGGTAQTDETALLSTSNGQTGSAGQTASSGQESQLPGADMDPCCMGSAAAEMLEVLTGFIEEELEDRRYFLALARQAPAWARQRLRDMAMEDESHARRLMAVYYLVTGDCYRPHVSCDRICIGRWCPALRERYHAEACGGLNYARAAEGTTDPCLTRLLNELSADEYRHANQLLAMLERGLPR